jgi:hypothetical protein
LAALLPLGTTAQDIPERLALYEKVRDERAHTVQEFTRQAGEDLHGEKRAKFNSKIIIMGILFYHNTNYY